MEAACDTSTTPCCTPMLHTTGEVMHGRQSQGARGGTESGLSEADTGWGVCVELSAFPTARDRAHATPVKRCASHTAASAAPARVGRSAHSPPFGSARSQLLGSAAAGVRSHTAPEKYVRVSQRSSCMPGRLLLTMLSLLLTSLVLTFWLFDFLVVDSFC
eukprot:366453-Chlamydomonas_euryale.AAC.21